MLRDVLLPLLVELLLLLGLVRPGLSLVPHVRLVAQLRVRPVGDNLNAAVRKLNSLNKIILHFRITSCLPPPRTTTCTLLIKMKHFRPWLSSGYLYFIYPSLLRPRLCSQFWQNDDHRCRLHRIRRRTAGGDSSPPLPPPRRAVGSKILGDFV